VKFTAFRVHFKYPKLNSQFRIKMNTKAIGVTHGRVASLNPGF
jgi:hypothetical protein